MKVEARIRRFDPTTDAEPRFQTFTLDGLDNMRVLDVVRSIYENQDGELAFQYSCRNGRCGTCGVKVNGRPVLACQERAKPEMTIEPLSPFPTLRDLVVDRTEAETRYAQYSLVPDRCEPHAGERDEFDPLAAREVGELGSCISCMICVSACPAVEARPFDGPAFMLQLRRLDRNPADQGKRLKQAVEGGLLECFGCDICTEMCPAELSPADAIRGFRRNLWGFGSSPIGSGVAK